MGGAFLGSGGQEMVGELKLRGVHVEAGRFTDFLPRAIAAGQAWSTLTAFGKSSDRFRQR